MNLLLADSFTAALARLPANDAKAVKTTVVDLQIDATAPGLQMHRIDNSKDANFWSVRVGRDLRLIVHKTAASMLVAYVDHHDKAYAWAERRRIEAHPTTGAMQIVEVRERVEELALPYVEPVVAPTASLPTPLFAKLDEAALLSIGAPTDWLADIRSATEDDFLDIAAHLPAEAAEALLQYADTGRLVVPPAPPTADPLTHPDTQRRIRLVTGEEELRQALDYPWDKWSVFLHPSQAAVVARRFNGPARVSGSAGTGKTVVALHRAVSLARANPSARALLTTFSEPLATQLAAKLRVLAPETGGIVPRITVADWASVADELFQLMHGRRPRIASASVIAELIASAAASGDVRGFAPRFLESEWTNVIDAWGICDLDAYARVPRLGHRAPLGPKQRARLWPVFEAVAKGLSDRDLMTRAQVARAVAAHYSGLAAKPFAYIVVDEAQDLGPAELTMLAALDAGGENALFFAGDLGQRIFQHPFSWTSLGIDVRGRSATLKVCYRTSRQIRAVADGLLPPAIRDVDGNEEERSGTVSVFEGPAPVVVIAATVAEEAERVRLFVKDALADGIEGSEIGIFVRDADLLGRARTATDGLDANLQLAVMHLAKGLEFKAVVVMACDEDILPFGPRIAAASDEGELNDIYETERQLLYVAATRARQHLLVTGVSPGSAFLTDLMPIPNS